MGGLRRSKCWPNDPDYLDGTKKVDLPSERLVAVYWDTDILDPEDEPSHKIIDAADSFTVRFRIELVGELWACMAGDWLFDLGLTPIGTGTGFNLSDKLGVDQFWVRGWTGCKGRCIMREIRVPPNTIPIGLYECGSRFQFYCCGKPAPVVGFESLEERQFFVTPFEDEPS